MDPLAFTRDIVKKAGDVLLQGQQNGFDVKQKGGDPRNIVTSVDAEVNTFLTDAIRQAFPSHGITSEEDVGTDQTNEMLWVIDPIDGTANFSRGIPHFSICLGLLVRGIPEVGAVYNPVTHELFHFQKGNGAFLNGAPIHVSTAEDIGDAHIFFHAGRKKDVRDWGGESYRRLLGSAKKTSNFGSSALDICFVAAGRIEATIYGTLSTFDIAPALGILSEAGGVASDRMGQPLTFTNEPKMVFTANNRRMLDSVRTLLTS